MKGEIIRRTLTKVSVLSVTVAILTLFFLCCNDRFAYATHLRYGHISWVPGTSLNTIDFTFDGAFRRDGYSGSASDGFVAVGDIITEWIGFTVFFFGDGNSAGSPLQFKVTSIDPTNNWLFGRALEPGSSTKATITHTYPSAGNYTAFIDSCCRISSIWGINAHINNPDGCYRVETLVNVGGSSGTPVSALPPIVLCPQNAVCSFTVPGPDPDGGTLNFRLSNPAEASSCFDFNQPGLPEAPNAASINPSTGLYTWDTTGATLGPSGNNTLYSTQVTIENLDAVGNVRDKSAVDFLIQLVPVVGVSPVFDSLPTPACGSTLTGNIGSTTTFTVQASDSDSGQTVTLNVAGMPPSATMTPSLPTSGNPVSSTFSWTPTPGEAGIFVMTFTATDNTGQQALCSITVQVFVEDCTNGIDDDGDGLVDCADPDCANHPDCQLPQEDCANGIDDDGDGLVDCDDPDCANHPDCIITPINNPPDCSGALPSLSEVWPPNHKMVSVNILGVADADGDPVTITITGITQDEPKTGTGLGSGNTCPDGAGVGTSAAQVRAERSGNPKVPGNGRVYEISFKASDGKGGECTGSVNVCVPHDMRPGHVCIDDGQIYDSTTCP